VALHPARVRTAAAAAAVEATRTSIKAPENAKI
jgi:hypothetical protein